MEKVILSELLKALFIVRRFCWIVRTRLVERESLDLLQRKEYEVRVLASDHLHFIALAVTTLLPSIARLRSLHPIEGGLFPQRWSTIQS